MDTVIEKKRTVQRNISKRAKGWSIDQRRAADRVIQGKLFALPEMKRAHSVCIYVSVPEEVDTHAIIEKLFANGKMVVVPKVSQSRTLIACRIQSFHELTSGAFGILEPGQNSPRAQINDIDVCIIPGVAFGRSGNRLGRGKGYYDRFLAECHAPKIALAYSFQIVSRLPASDYDIPMDTIITDHETIECTPRHGANKTI